MLKAKGKCESSIKQLDLRKKEFDEKKNGQMLTFKLGANVF